MFNPNSTVDPTYIWQLLGSFYKLVDSDSKALIEAYWTGLLDGTEGLFYNLAQAHLSMYLDKTQGFLEHGYETFDFRFTGLDPNYTSRTRYSAPTISGWPDTPSGDNELYSYVVTSLYNSGESTPSLPALLISGATDLSATPNNLGWSLISGVDSYNIYGKTQNSFYYLGNSTSGDFIDNGLTATAAVPPTVNAAIESYLFDLPPNRLYLTMPVLSGIDSSQILNENTDFTIENLTQIKFANNLTTTEEVGKIQVTEPVTDELSLKVLNPTSLTTIPSLTSIYFPAFGQVNNPESIITSGFYTPHLSGYFDSGTGYYDKQAMYGKHLSRWTHALVSGLRSAPTMSGITNTVSLLYNLPFAYEAGTLTGIVLNGGYNYVTISGAETACYRVPSGLYLRYEVDDIVGQYNILCSGVQIDDYLSNAVTISGLMTREGSTTELDVFAHHKGGSKKYYHVAKSVEEDTVTAPLTSPIILNKDGGKNG